MADRIEVERQDAVDQSILSGVAAIAARVDNATSFKTTFWVLSVIIDPHPRARARAEEMAGLRGIRPGS